MNAVPLADLSPLPVSRADAISRLRNHVFEDALRWQKPGTAPSLLLEEGLLQTPRFVPHPPMLSGTVVGLFGDVTRYVSTGGYGPRCGWTEEDGPVWGEFPCLPGWAENDLARRAPDMALMQRGEPILKQMVTERIGGSAWADPPPILLPAGLTAVYVTGPEAVAEAMLDDALQRTEAARLVLVESTALQPLHKDVFARLAEKIRRLGGQAIMAPCDPWPLLDHAEALHCAGDDPIALLGLLMKIKVYCHQPGLAAGWGPTIDMPLIRKQDVSRTCLEILTAALLTGSRYASPFTGRQISIETALDLATDWRRLSKINRRIGGLVGLPRGERFHLEKFFHTGQSVPPQGIQAADAAQGQYVAVWAGPTPDELASSLKDAGLGLLWASPGVVEQPGAPPISIVLDDEGSYQDPAHPSGLDKLLNRVVFDAPLLARASDAIARIRRERISLGGFVIGEPASLNAPRSQRRMLLLDDPPPVKGKPTALLTALRAMHPDAFIIHCPAQLGGDTGLADQIVTPAQALSVLDHVDDIHTGCTKLGFEALLHGHRPMCERPSFYTGWGLTTDRVPSPRRERNLTLEELVAGVLVLYHHYLDPRTGLPCPLDLLLDRLRDQKVADMVQPKMGLLARLKKLFFD